ncbi:MAG TPA: ABC transporter ATP-binding protein [Chloroflexota bacterium]|jgi:peptide/nickel transport system ATP-binding protein
MTGQSVLEIRGLEVEFVSEGRAVRAVDGVDLEIRPGEMVGLVGETGCGKSVTALSVLGLVASPPGRIVGGQILFEGTDLLRLSQGQLRRIRGAGISMIFQEPMTSLDPSFTVGSQMAEVLATHRGLRGNAADQESLRWLRHVRMQHPERVLRQYPFELSGGMRQRVMIATALSCGPRLLIADEPTTALDVTVQAQILTLLGDLQRETGTAVLLITHDLGLVAEYCDRVYVMYAGRVAEAALVDDLFEAPLHPYTQGLLQAIPGVTRRDDADRRRRLNVIPGDVPAPGAHPPGCLFSTRCPHVMPVCRDIAPPLVERAPDHAAACYLHDLVSVGP